MKKLTVGSLFSGIGGFDLGLEMSGGFEIEWQVEIDPFCKKVLAKHWPNVARYGDIRKVGKHNLQPVDLIAGGFPCQPHSLAGKRQASADERDLWGEFYRVVCELKPRWVLAENVMGLLSSEDGSFFGRVLRDLAQAGYDAEWIVRRASDVGAPHRRERVFIMAHLSGIESNAWRTQPEDQRWTPDADGAGTSDILSDADGNRQWIRQVQHERSSQCETAPVSGDDGTQELVANATCARLSQWRSDRLPSNATQIGAGGDAESQRYSAMEYASSPGRQELNVATIADSERYATGRPATTGIERAAQSCFCRDPDGIPRKLDQHRWPAGPGEPQHEWEPPRVITEKQPHRVARLKALGNAIVPQLVTEIGRSILEFESSRVS